MAMTWDLVLAMSLWLSGAAVPLSGQVVDAVSGQPVPEARVELRRARQMVRADSTGVFSFGERDVELDTLVVSHPQYLEARVLVGDVAGETLHLRVALSRRRAEVPDASVAAAILGRARELAEELEGHLWERQDFLAHAGEVQTPIGLLVFSGFVEDVLSFEDGWCVQLAGGADCAAIWVDGGPGGMAGLLERFAAETAAIVIVPPSRSPPNGIVILFMFERGA